MLEKANLVSDLTCYVCSCADGYEGDDCQIDINECAGDPCQNGATCNDLVAKYSCDCIKGYEGDNCEKDIDECDR